MENRRLTKFRVEPDGRYEFAVDNASKAVVSSFVATFVALFRHRQRSRQRWRRRRNASTVVVNTGHAHSDSSPTHRHGHFPAELARVKKLFASRAVFMDKPGDLHVVTAV